MTAAWVTKRENSGAGFFTTINVPIMAVRVTVSHVLGHETHARIQGLEHGIRFVLFIRDGRLNTLEGYTYESTDTHSLDLENLDFEVFREAVNRTDKCLLTSLSAVISIEVATTGVDPKPTFAVEVADAGGQRTV